MSKEKWSKQAKTVRGDKVIELVLGAAQSLLQERWLNKISIRSLAEKAGVERASLFYQFKRGWPDIACTLAGGVLFREFDSILIEHLDERTRDDASSCATRALMSFVDLAEGTGKLVSNLRSQMFVWGQDGDSYFHLPGQDYNQELAEVLSNGKDKVTDSHIYAAESLINFSLDIAGGAGLYPWTAEERRKLLTKNVEITVTGLSAMITSDERCVI